MPQFLKDYGERLVELGYTVLPIRPGTKRPDLKNWPHHATTADDVRAWYSNGRAGHGAGINARNTPAIDVDVMDREVADAMSDAIDRIFPGVALLTRTGLAPKFLIPFRSDEPFHKLTSSVYTDGKHEHKVEILGDGQQWVAYHVHPDTGQPYAWWDGLGAGGIVDLEHEALPVLGREDAQRVLDAFEVLAHARMSSGQWRAVTRASEAKDRSSDADPFAEYAQPVTDLTRAQIETLIHKLDWDSRDDWVRAGRILHHQYGGGDEGLEIWNAWATNSSKWQAETEAAVWESFGHRHDAPETIRGLIKEFGQPPAEKAKPLETDRKFRFYPGAEYAEDFIGGPELVEDVLPRQGTGMMFGPSGSGKTFWILDLAFHVQNGARWRDKDVAKGDVMYIAAEAGRGIKKRIRGVLNANPGWTAPFFADMAPDLGDMEWIRTIMESAQAVGTPAMVIIDTMSASFAGDDSSQADVAPMIRNLTSLSLALQCLVVFVHHTTKEGTSWRGSGAFFADVDAVLELVSVGEGAARKQHIVQRKHRDGEAGKEYPFSLRITEPLGTKPNGKDITTMVVEQSDERAAKKDRKEGTNARFLREVFAEIDAGMGEITAADLLDAASEKFGKGFRRDNYRRTLGGMIGYEGVHLPYETVIYL